MIQKSDTQRNLRKNLIYVQYKFFRFGSIHSRREWQREDTKFTLPTRTTGLSREVQLIKVNLTYLKMT